jgi:hypothetical protein
MAFSRVFIICRINANILMYLVLSWKGEQWVFFVFLLSAIHILTY